MEDFQLHVNLLPCSHADQQCRVCSLCFSTEAKTIALSFTAKKQTVVLTSPFQGSNIEKMVLKTLDAQISSIWWLLTEFFGLHGRQKGYEIKWKTFNFM